MADEQTPPADLQAGTHVLVIGQFYTDSVASHIAETLGQMGYPTVRFEPAFPIDGTTTGLRKHVAKAVRRIEDLTQGLPLMRSRFAGRLRDAARSANIGLTLVCHDYLQPNEVDELREITRAPVALWFPDHIGRFGRAWLLNACYDGLFFKDPYIVETLQRSLDKPIFYLPEAYNPHRHQVRTEQTGDAENLACDLCTAGNLYSYRTEFFAQLSGYDVRIWGYPPPLWMKTGAINSMIQNRYVGNAEKAAAFRAAKICLNNLHPAEIYGLNARAFEIAGCGGFQLLDWRPALRDLFIDGEELVSFRSMADLREKIDHYLAHDAERNAIADRGRARALRDHTFEHRLRLLIDTVEGRAAGYAMPRIRMERSD